MLMDCASVVDTEAELRRMVGRMMGIALLAVAHRTVGCSVLLGLAVVQHRTVGCSALLGLAVVQHRTVGCSALMGLAVVQHRTVGHIVLSCVGERRDAGVFHTLGVEEVAESRHAESTVQQGGEERGRLSKHRKRLEQAGNGSAVKRHTEVRCTEQG